MADQEDQEPDIHHVGIARKVRHAARIVLAIPVWLYQKIISPAIPPHCIYTPTCSEYTRRAILKHGIAGVFAGVLRVFRCVGGLYTGGPDPVPDRLTWSYLFGSYRRFWRRGRK